MTPTARILAAAVLGLLLASCGNPAAPQGNYGTVFGVVKNASGQPVAGAIVTADTVISSAPTGSDGKFTIQTVPVDSPTTTTSVTCAAPGYQNPPAQSVTVVSGKQIEADFTLTPL